MTRFEDLNTCDRTVLLSLLVTGGISVLAGCMILVSFYFIKKIRTLTFGLIFVMTVAEVISRLAYIVNYNPPETGTWQCYTQAFFVQYFISLSMYFSLAVSTHMYSLIVARKVFRMTKPLFFKVVFAAMLFALICACIPFTTNQYGNIGPFCWILLEKDDGDEYNSRDVGYTMRVTLMHGQIWLIYVLNSIFYIRIYKFIVAVTKLARQSRDINSEANTDCTDPQRSSFGEGVSKRSRSDSKDSSVEKTVRILQYYPIILIVTWLPLIIMRIFEYATFDIPCWVFAFSLGMTNLQGLCNAIVFFSYDSVRLNWIEIFTSAFIIADEAKILLRDTAAGSSLSTSKSISGGCSSNASSMFDPQVAHESKMDDTL